MNSATTDLPRSERLRTMTREAHEQVDSSVIAAGSMDDVPGYGRFLQMQWAFHRDIDALYDSPALRALLPDLPGRRRLALIGADLEDLALAPATNVGRPVFGSEDDVDVATALGWLYVAEGSNMGAALLRKQVTAFGLSDSYGARHLAPAPEGPAAHWRAFKNALDSVDLDEAQDSRVISGARDAFARVKALGDDCLG